MRTEIASCTNCSTLPLQRPTCRDFPQADGQNGYTLLRFASKWSGNACCLMRFLGGGAKTCHTQRSPKTTFLVLQKGCLVLSVLNSEKQPHVRNFSARILRPEMPIKFLVLWEGGLGFFWGGWKYQLYFYGPGDFSLVTLPGRIQGASPNEEGKCIID